MELTNFKGNVLGPYIPEQEFRKVTHDGVTLGIFYITQEGEGGFYSSGPDALERVKRALPTEMIVFAGSGGRISHGKMAELKDFV
ncbi:MAG: hypothetical protein MUP55_01795 [Candidatus Aenigmarchaeota archaeon]|nr:hypothetical protein [Candidatus Aenigmarchaeota archaeon]